jgi:hypothetical protein
LTDEQKALIEEAIEALTDASSQINKACLRLMDAAELSSLLEDNPWVKAAHSLHQAWCKAYTVERDLKQSIKSN